jgi:hypothetical protein
MTRRIDIGAVISKVFRTYGEYAGVLLGVAAIIYLINALFRFAGDDSVGIALLGGFIGLVLSYLYTGMVVELVNDTRDGELDSSVSGLIRAVTPVLVTLILAGILAGIGIAIGFVLIIVPGVFLLTIWSLIAPVIVVERVGVLPSFGRSWELVKGNFWQVLAVILLFYVITFAITAIVVAVADSIGRVVVVVAVWIVGLLLAPLSALASSILYFELRGATAPIDRPVAPPPVAGLAGDRAAPPPPPAAPAR